MASSPVLYALAVLCVYVMCDRAIKWYRLRHIPGPWINKFSVLPIAVQCFRGRFHEVLQGYFKTYGPLVRIGPNEIICNDVPTLTRILGSKSPYNKAQWFLIARLNGDGDTMQSMFNKVQREKRKNQVMPGYSGKDNDGFEKCIDRAINAFVHLIDTKYTSTATDYRPVDFASRCGFFAMDVIGEVAVSQPFGFLAEDRDVYNILRSYDMTLPIIQIMGNYPWLAKMLHRWPISLVLPKEGDGAGFGAATSFYMKIVDNRLREGSKPKRDILQSFISRGLDREELKQEMSLVFLAGSDTTANALRMTMLCLLSNAAAQAALRAEIDAHADAPSPVPDSVTQNLPYLGAVIREMLRVYPPVNSSLFQKEVPPQGDTILGTFVPGGTSVGTGGAIYPVCRSREVWGADADVFRPERWLEADETTLAHMKEAWELVFSIGQFRCLGKPLALLTMRKVIFELFRRYEFQAVNSAQPGKFFAGIVWIWQGLHVRISKRESVTL